MSPPAYFTHGRSYAERDLDPSLITHTNPFRGHDFNVDDWVNSSAYAEDTPQLVFPQQSTFNGIPTQGPVPDLYVTHDFQQQMYPTTAAATPHYSIQPTIMGPMASLLPSSSTSSSQLTGAHYIHQHNDHSTGYMHHRRGLTPVLTPTPSPSSSISSMSDVHPVTPGYGAVPPPPEYAYHHPPYAISPPIYSASVEHDFDAEGSLDPEDLEDEEYQSQVARWITHNTNPAHQDYCDMCRKRFNRACDFRRHVETLHVKRERGFPCTWPGCTRIMSRKDVLQRHVKRQHEDKEKKKAKTM
ncbi:hypothetical protein CALVIDRAFT_595582 [Calocera viscosa TUFC12733]|uniref:C2H2-type domain-containing protein n=1 Tax=Calocera viscosa (strain TUFC12733) TaxID=1330018 RepID=A0A167QRX8_CALVF|nr:hypothetical protein CALVIDRAFT_595582 [Calocera viscosa TUFC12733]